MCGSHQSIKKKIYIYHLYFRLKYSKVVGYFFCGVVVLFVWFLVLEIDYIYEEFFFFSPPGT